jgi:hypothetical protein
MNRQNKERLTALERAHLQERYPSVPDHALAMSKWSDTSANGLTKCVTAWIQLNGYQAERINTMGVYREAAKIKDLDGISRTVGKGKWTKSTSTAGSSDISATIKGRSVKIEIKYGRDIQSDAQKRYQESIERAGGIYLIVTDFDIFVTWYDNFIQ